uniref:C2H2-type domain-containing protein n=1 Tax=Hordeum vulgare subsp. vulgare TaxID=112509 RepID=A0A8I6XNS5_HORVV
MCQAKCNSKAQFKHHCTSRKHQQKIQVVLGEGDIAKVSSLLFKVPCKEDSNNDMAKNVVSQEAKSNEKNVPQHAEKPPLVGCSTCQVICGHESDLEIHLKGKRHLKNIQAIFEESNKAINSESLKANLNPDRGPLHVEKMNCGLDSENHLSDERHQLTVRTLCKTINQEENSPPEICKDQTPSSEWDWAMCQAKCVSEAHFENHCISRKNQQRTQVILSE